eukprot:2401121-Amphidinium_carterae.1
MLVTPDAWFLAVVLGMSNRNVPQRGRDDIVKNVRMVVKTGLRLSVIGYSTSRTNEPEDFRKTIKSHNSPPNFGKVPWIIEWI